MKLLARLRRALARLFGPRPPSRYAELAAAFARTRPDPAAWEVFAARLAASARRDGLREGYLLAKAKRADPGLAQRLAWVPSPRSRLAEEGMRPDPKAVRAAALRADVEAFDWQGESRGTHRVVYLRRGGAR